MRERPCTKQSRFRCCYMTQAALQAKMFPIGRGRLTTEPAASISSHIVFKNEGETLYKTISLPLLLYDASCTSSEDVPSAAYRTTSDSTRYGTWTGGEFRPSVCGSAKVTASKKTPMLTAAISTRTTGNFRRSSRAWNPARTLARNEAGAGDTLHVLSN